MQDGISGLIQRYIWCNVMLAHDNIWHWSDCHGDLSAHRRTNLVSFVVVELNIMRVGGGSTAISENLYRLPWRSVTETPHHQRLASINWRSRNRFQTVPTRLYVISYMCWDKQHVRIKRAFLSWADLIEKIVLGCSTGRCPDRRLKRCNVLKTKHGHSRRSIGRQQKVVGLVTVR